MDGFRCILRVNWQQAQEQGSRCQSSSSDGSHHRLYRLPCMCNLFLRLFPDAYTVVRCIMPFPLWPHISVNSIHTISQDFSGRLVVFSKWMTSRKNPKPSSSGGISKCYVRVIIIFLLFTMRYYRQIFPRKEAGKSKKSKCGLELLKDKLKAKKRRLNNPLTESTNVPIDPSQVPLATSTTVPSELVV